MFAWASGVSVGPGMIALIRTPFLSSGYALLGDVEADGQLALEVVGLAVVERPLRRLVHVLDGEVLTEDLHVVVAGPTGPGGRRDEPDRAAPTEHPGVEHPVDHVTVAEEVDLLDARRAVGDAGAREQRVDAAAALVDRGVDRRLVGEVDRDRAGDPGDVHRGEVHRHHFGAGVDEQTGGGVAHTGGGTDDHDALAVVAEQIEQGHGGTPNVGEEWIVDG